MKIGKINIEQVKGSYRLRWTDPFFGRRSLTVCSTETVDGQKLASVKASEIDSDLAKELLGIPGHYDSSLEKYKPGYTSKAKLTNLLEIWKNHKIENDKSTPNSRKKSVWKIVDNMLLKLNKNQLIPQNSGQVVKELSKHYSPSTLNRCLADVVKATNDWSKSENVSNPWIDIRSQIRIPKKAGSRSKQTWNRKELNIIRESFMNNHYYGYISFLILTGCRPEEAIALRKTDVGSKLINIDKAFSYGELKGTKNDKHRKFPINPQLEELIKNQNNTQSDLLFPSTTGGYIEQKKFNQRQFKPRVEKLFNEGVISKKLPSYNIRNSWITLVLREGLDIATVAGLAGTSERMIMNNYWGADDSVVIPEI
ncbi:MAG: tyrosine-type recombinase/integrase [Cyanobacteria bacterium P01_H01_bin.35]